MNALDKLKRDIMNASEILKLKTEHARYKTALVNILCSESNAIAQKALYPTPPPPVTLPELLSALERWKIRTNDYIAIHFNPDESGTLLRGTFEDEIFEFTTLRQALDFLNKL